jgi:hypothetical protein
MREALEFNGYTVFAAENGQVALDQLGRIDRTKPLRGGFWVMKRQA